MCSSLVHRLPLPILAIVIAAFASLPISAQTYDAENDFSTVSNPSPGGIWRYGWSDDLNSPLVLYDNFVPSSAYDIWHDPDNSDGFLTPLVQHNPNSTPSGPHQPHSLSLHPSFDGDYSHVRFTAPVPGLYSFTAAFTIVSGATTDVHILLNNAVPALFSGTVDSTGDASYSTPQPIVLAAGDTIDFAVGFGINGHSSDSTRLEASITLIDDCPADISPQPVGDDAVDVNDLLAVITTWGACPPVPADCPGDINNDDTVSVNDLLAVITTWGTCPPACNPTGQWSNAVNPAYNCAFGMVNFNIAHWTITTQSNLLKVTGAGLPVMMTGPEVACSPGQSFTVTGFYPGGCNETYSLSGTFTSSNQFIATFTAAYGGQCFGCTTQVFSITATRQ